MKDLDGELGVFDEYSRHAQLKRDAPETGNEGAAFYDNLLHDLEEDLGEVDKEPQELWDSVTRLSQFQYKYSDNDGKTTRLEHSISKGADIFFGDDEIKRKYQHLVKPEFCITLLQHSSSDI